MTEERRVVGEAEKANNKQLYLKHRMKEKVKEGENREHMGKIRRNSKE